MYSEIEEIDELCRKLKPLPGIGNKIEGLKYSYLSTNDTEERKEIKSWLHILTLKLLDENAVLLPPPSPEDSSGELVIGNVIYNNKKLFPIGLRENEISKQVLIAGMIGEGKSNVAQILALYLLRKKIPFLVIDPKKTWRSLLSLDPEQFPGLKDLQVLTVSPTAPFRWNSKQTPPGINYEDWLEIEAEALQPSFLGQVGVEDIYLRIYDKLIKKYGLDKEKPKFYLNFYDASRELDDLEVEGFRETGWKSSTKRILRRFTRGSVATIFNSRQPIRLEDVLSRPTIIELDKSSISKRMVVFLQEMLLKWIYNYRVYCGESDELKHCIFLDEVHQLFPQSRIEKESADSLQTIFKQIRSYGEGIISISQEISEISKRCPFILSQAHSLIVLSLQHADDILAARKSLFLKPEEEIYFDMLKTGDGIVKIKGRVNACPVRFPLVPIKKGIITDEIVRKRYGYSAFSKPGKAEFWQKEAFPQGFKNNNQETGEMDRTAEKLLTDVLKYQTSPLVKRYKRLGLSMRKGNECKWQLVSQGFVKTKEIVTKTCRYVLLELTQKGKLVLRDLGYEVKDTTESVIHKFFKERIADYYRKKGYEVWEEKERNGKADVIVRNGNKSTAFEIETGLGSDYMQNIERDFQAGFDEIVCVAVNEFIENKIKKDLENKPYNEKVKVIPASGFDIG